ncbi:MAG: threonylcarbamoyl-AMP synthase [Pseudomonadales bacterium]|nr:threonylcarbamoyl-AMP synthase [Pseudomonadales bacterium]
MPTITRDIDAAVERLRAGELVAIPTETVYGLAADARNPAAIARVYALKQRPASNPLIVHVAAPDWVDDWAVEIPDAARRLMAACWPGPLTLVLAARADVPAIVTAGQDSVAIRQPDHPLCLELLNRFGRAVVAPSANRYMSISPTTPDHVVRQFPESDLLILDGGPCAVGVESTIVSLLPDEPPRLLRPGMLARAAVERILGCVLADAHDTSVRVPGQHERHYAPALPAWRFTDIDADRLADPRLGWLLCGQGLEVAGPTIDLGNDPDAYARRLYAALYRLEHSGVDGICVQLPPDTEPWRAIRDRLQRATLPMPEVAPGDLEQPR